jgi:hypothetical protein
LLPTVQKLLGRGILDVFCACPNGTPVPLAFLGFEAAPDEREIVRRERHEGGKARTANHATIETLAA